MKVVILILALASPPTGLPEVGLVEAEIVAQARSRRAAELARREAILAARGYAKGQQRHRRMRTRYLADLERRRTDALYLRAATVRAHYPWTAPPSHCHPRRYR